MEAKELLIDKYYLKKGEVFKMDSKELSNILDVGGEYNFEPIPLTEEWLVSFGFDNSGGSAYDYKKIDTLKHLYVSIPKDLSYISLVVEETGMYPKKVHPKLPSEIKYVHQLQNLYFALCGQELVLK